MRRRRRAIKVLINDNYQPSQLHYFELNTTSLSLFYQLGLPIVEIDE